MIVNQTSSVPPAGSPSNSSTSAKADLDYNSFLKLLVATMQNQDPTQPNDPAQTLSQLASFSNVEQSIKLNDKLDSLLSMSGAGQAAGLVGKTVTSLDGKTTGVVESVEVGSKGLTVVIEGGTRIDISGGFKVS